MLFNIIVGSIMIISFIGIVICGKKQSDNSAAKPLAMVFMLIVVICGIVLFVKYTKKPDPRKYIKENQEFQKSSAFILAEYLKQGLPAPQVIVLLDKSKDDDPVQKALKEGLKLGFAGTTANIIYETPLVKITKNQNGLDKNIMDVTKAKDVNLILSKYPKCKILITLIGLPKDLGELDLVKKFQDEGKNFPVKIGCLNCNIYHYQGLIKIGFITAATIPDPVKKFKMDSPSSDMKTTFDKKFILITSKNVDKIAAKFPGKFFQGPLK